MISSRAIGSHKFSAAVLACAIATLTYGELTHAKAPDTGSAIAQVQRLQVRTPTVTGPISVTTTPGVGDTRNYPFFSAEPQVDLARAGYVEEEFFIDGTATRFDTPALSNAIQVSSGHPYKTRIVVRRPVNEHKFNGVVMVEWANVTSGYGIDIHWQQSYEYLMREGYAFVRVDAQRVGVHQPNSGLKDWSPNRYGSLDLTAGGSITDDSLSYDIFSQIAKAIKSPDLQKKLLGGLHPKILLAVGQSQSARRLTLYYNSIQPLHQLVDGFLIQVQGGPFRTDVKTPMMRVISETELAISGLGESRQPDGPNLRGWEITGAAHVEYTWVQHRQALATRDKMTPPNLACSPEPASHVPLHYVMNAGYHHLVNWITRGVAPPHAKPVFMTSIKPAVIPRDANGIAYGGIRQPQVEVPLATNRGDQPGMSSGCPKNYGMHVPFDDEKLAQLYPSKDDYLRSVRAAVRTNVQEGFLLKEDAEEIIQRAESSNAGTGRAVSIR